MEHHVDSNGCRIAYQVDEGPPGAPALLLINSIGTTRELWTRQVSAFSPRFRVLRYDARGHGASSVPAGEYSIEQLGRDALAILDDQGVSAAHICGISLGGITAMWVGVHAPERVSSLVLANTAARIGSVESWTNRIALVRERGMTGVADVAIPLWFTQAFRERDPDTVHSFYAMLQSCPQDGYLGCCAALRDADLREAIRGIQRPVLAVAGAADASTTPGALAFIREAIPGAQMVTLDTAHLSNVEDADGFAGATLDFWASNSW